MGAKEAQEAYEQVQNALEIFQKVGYKRGVADAQNLSCIVRMVTRSDLPEGARNCEEAARLYREIGYRRGEADAYGNLGIIFRIAKDYESAITKLNEALSIDKEIGFKLGIGRQLANLGRCYAAKKDQRSARNYFLTAREIFREMGAAYELAAIEQFLKNPSGVD